MAFLLIFMMVAEIIAVILLGVVLMRLQKTASLWNELAKEFAGIHNRLDCLDNQGHLFLKKLDALDTIPYIKSHCDNVLELEKAKSKGIAAWREENNEQHKVILSGIEDRYNMIYEEFKDIKGMLWASTPLTPTGEARSAAQATKARKKEEKVLLVKRLKEEGKSNKDISKETGIPESTVRSYLKSPGLISPDEEDHLGMPQIDDPAAYQKYVDRVINGKLDNEAVNGMIVDTCPFNPTHGTCPTACSDACHDCVESAWAFNMQD